MPGGESMREKSQNTELTEAIRAARPRHCLSSYAAILTRARLPIQLAASITKRGAGITAHAPTIAAALGALPRCGALGAVENAPTAAPMRASL
jgi:hypothetical protein